MLDPGVKVPAAGVARILPESEQAHAHKVIAANWSLPMKLLERSLDRAGEAFGAPTTYIEVTPNR